MQWPDLALDFRRAIYRLKIRSSGWDNMLDKSAQQGRAPLADHRDDFYATPPEAVHALMKAEAIPSKIWEPACGDGAIVKILRASGRLVHATDLVDRGCPDSQSAIDFLMERSSPLGIEAIVTNPPYVLARQFVEHSLRMAPKVYMLLRLAFLEGSGRNEILDGGRLARVLVFRNRLPMIHRHGWTGNKASSSIAFAWFCWDLAHREPTQLHRITWEKLP